MRLNHSTLLLFFAFAACGDSDVPDPHRDASVPDASASDASASDASTQDAGDCLVPAHLQWSSTTLEECGLAAPLDGGPTVALCHWNLALANDGTGTWSHSDVIESITHSCSGTELHIAPDSQAGSAATYDAESGFLTYDGIAYCPTNDVGCPPVD
jgi:hypothetical protein